MLYCYADFFCTFAVEIVGSEVFRFPFCYRQIMTMNGAKSAIREYVAVTAVMCVIMLNVLDSTIVNVALPTLAMTFGVSDSAVTWVVNSYLMLIPMLMLTFSLVGDVWGYRRVFVVGSVLFGIGSLLCGFAQGFVMLLAGRMVQGVGAACVMGVNTALVRIIFPREKLGMAMGMNAMVVAVSSAAGPALAGVILHYLSWPWLFYINVPIALLSLAVGVALLPANPPLPQGVKHRFDSPSAVLNAAFFCLLFLGVDTFAQGNNPMYAGIELAAAAVIGVVYLRRQMGLATPLFPVDLMRNPIFSLSVGTSVCSYTAQSLAYIALPFYMHYVLHFDPVQIGTMITPWPIATMITAPLAGRLVGHFKAGAICAVGMCLFALGFVSLLMYDAGSGSLQLVWRLALCGVGFGLFQTPNNVTLVSSAPKHRSGGASGMLGTARVVGQALGTTLAALLFRIFDEQNQSTACLIAGIAMALTAATVSALRLRQQ